MPLLKRAASIRRASGECLDYDLEWFMGGALTDEGVRLRRAKMSDDSAKKAKNYFLMLVQFTDERHGYTPPGHFGQN